jgi:hypothetical protein
MRNFNCLKSDPEETFLYEKMNIPNYVLRACGNPEKEIAGFGAASTTFGSIREILFYVAVPELIQ